MSDSEERFTIWHGLFLGEATAILIALATTIVPGKSGSKTGLAGYLVPDPTFLEEFAINLVLVNLLILLLAAGMALWVWLSGAGRSSQSSTRSRGG